jgi:hypothetical protein
MGSTISAARNNMKLTGVSPKIISSILRIGIPPPLQSLEMVGNLATHMGFYVVAFPIDFDVD